MNDVIRYGKPSITNLPVKLGLAIFKQILRTPVPDREAMKSESDNLLNEMLKLRESENNAVPSE